MLRRIRTILKSPENGYLCVRKLVGAISRFLTMRHNKIAQPYILYKIKSTLNFTTSNADENFLRDRPDMKNTIKRRTYQDQEAAREIASLRDTVDALVQRVQTLESMVGVKERNESLPPPPLSPVTKKRKRSCEDFESEQPQNETKTLPALPSDVMDMDMDWNATEIMTTTPIKRETTEELSEFLEGMDFQDTRKRTLARPSLIRNPSWESVCENMSLPGDISAHDAAKVGEVLSYLMPQIQAALLNQMQKSSSGSLLSI